MSDYIPQSLWIDILMRLPIETLVRCISLCKSWDSLITSPSFISQHILNRTTKANNLLLVRGYSEMSKKEHYSLHFDHNNTFGAYKTLDFPFKTFNLFFRVIGCSIGLVCLSDDQFSCINIMILWNPSIRKFVTLPIPRVTFSSHGPFMHFIGFGFNATTNDYKVVRVVYLEQGWRCIFPPVVEIYELSTNFWRSVDPMGFPYAMDERGSQAFLNGAAHWVGCNLNGVGGSFFNLIALFDIQNEVFGTIMVPYGLADQCSPRSIRVAVLGELLSLIHCTSSGDEDICCVWVMKQYGVTDSWVKLFTIDLKEGLQGAFGFRKNGKVILTKRRHSDIANFISYDPKTKQVKHLGLVYGNEDSFYVGNFVESLVLLDGINGKLGRQTKFGNAVVSEGRLAYLRKEEAGFKGNQKDEGETEDDYEEQVSG